MITRDKKIVVEGDFVVGHTYELVVAARSVPDAYGRVVEQDPENAPKVSITIAGKLAAPGIPTNVAAKAIINGIELSWTNPEDTDFSHVEIYYSTLPDFFDSAQLATAYGNFFIHEVGLPNKTYYYWVRARNTSNLPSGFVPTPPAVTLTATTLGVTATDIDDFAITATKMFTKAIILTADVWTNDSPNPGANTHISWNTHSIVYNGDSYPITAGNTALQYVYWTIGDATYSDSATHPTLGATAFMIAINTAGIHTLVWNDSANMVIGTAFIGDLQVTNAKIANLNVTEGKIAALAVTNAKIANATIQSAKIVNLDADKINVGILTGQTLRTDTAVAAHYKRVEVKGASEGTYPNSIIVYDDSNTAIIRLDDTLWHGAYPGLEIKSDSGRVHISNIAGNSTTTVGTGVVTAVSHTEQGGIFFGQADYTLVGTTNGIYVANIETAKTGNLFTGLIGVEYPTLVFSVDEAGDGYFAGDITIGGTVDGRDVASDGSKLNGIASGATVGATWSSNITGQPATFTPSNHLITVHNEAASPTNDDILIASEGAWTKVNITTKVNAIIAAWIVANGGTDTNFMTGGGDIANVTDGLIKSYTQ